MNPTSHCHSLQTGFLSLLKTIPETSTAFCKYHHLWQNYRIHRRNRHDNWSLKKVKRLIVAVNAATEEIKKIMTTAGVTQ
jgi:hypothetical protein